MSEIKISEMTEASSLNDQDLLTIVQGRSQQEDNKGKCHRRNNNSFK